MKLKAQEILTESDKDKMHRIRMIDPMDGGYVNRVTRMAEIKENVLGFALDVLADLELPSVPSVSVGNMRGFEEPKEVHKIRGYIVVHAVFDSLSGKKLRMSMPIPIYNGEFLRPSLIIVNSKKMVFSQQAVDQLLSGVETTRPVSQYPYSANPEYSHEETVQRGEFASFPDPVEWDETILDWKGMSPG
jgi:hypothetical protein